MDPRFEQFLHERLYLSNVSPRTIEWHRASLKWLANPAPDEATLKDFVMRMRNAGLKPSSCNCRIRSVNAYLRWAGSSLKVPRMKEDQRIAATFSDADIRKLIAWKPKGFCAVRIHVFLLVLMDTGCRSGEAMGLRWADVDFDNLLVKLHGKGAKDRIVPFSFELRRHLFRWKQLNRWDLVLPSRDGQWLGRRDQLRDVKLLCERLGIVAPARTIHAFRHTFATEYLRRGGSIFHLQRQLGHSSLEMVKKYAHLQTADLSAIHERVSLLSSRA